jgi:hypothetical protein
MTCLAFWVSLHIWFISTSAAIYIWFLCGYFKKTLVHLLFIDRAFLRCSHFPNCHWPHPSNITYFCTKTFIKLHGSDFCKYFCLNIMRLTYRLMWNIFMGFSSTSRSERYRLILFHLISHEISNSANTNLVMCFCFLINWSWMFSEGCSYYLKCLILMFWFVVCWFRIEILGFFCCCMFWFWAGVLFLMYEFMRC